MYATKDFLYTQNYSTTQDDLGATIYALQYKDIVKWDCAQ